MAGTVRRGGQIAWTRLMLRVAMLIATTEPEFGSAPRQSEVDPI